jgi:phage shock protein C
VARQLVRDPYSRLGGVASGIGHHYGIDVSLVRIAFVAFTVASGFGLLIYLLAWLIIPRAEYWPPVAAAKPIRALSAREVAIGLIVVAVLLAMFFSGGGLTQVLVPLVLVAGGVWMLSQPDAEDAARARQSAGFQPVDTVRPDDSTGLGAAPASYPSYGSPVADQFGATDPVPPPPVGGMPPGSPVTAPRRRWRRLLLIPVAVIVAIPIAAIVLLATADIDIDVSSVAVIPETADELPTSINEESADLLVDLSALDPSMFDGDPQSIDLSVDFGRVEVVVPEGLSVAVDAEVGVGEVNVFGVGDEGLDPEVQLDSDDPHIELGINVDFGEIVVRRPG